MKVSEVVVLCLTVKKLRLFSVGLGLMLLLACAGNASAADVLILAPTVTGGTASSEYRIITTPVGVPVPGFPAVTGLGLTADIVPAGPGPNTWPTPPQAYNLYKAIVLGDPTCTGFFPGILPVAAAESNAAVWAAAVTGNVVIIGTDPSVHPGAGGVSGIQLWQSAINFAVAGFLAGDGTGAVICLSCYYNSAPPSTPVPVLSGFGAFLTQGAACANTVAIVATSPALTGLTASTLSNWGCSVHEGFTSWPTTFMPLAIATDSTVPHVFTAGPVSGFPYILARGRTLSPAGEVLKVCKVAGPGIPVGTPFTFTAGPSTFTVPAGPPPGGTCVVGPSFPAGSTVTVTETIPPGHTVSSITVAPASQLVGTPNLAGGSVNVLIGGGVTEVTFTDKRTGFLEICKRGRVSGTFTFNVNPGGLGPFVVPAGACSPAIEVDAGSVVITELPTPGIAMSGCSTIPASQQGPCNLSAQTSTVTVAPGNISTMTIAFINNRRILIGTDTTTAIRCAPSSAHSGQQVTCTARVSAVSPGTGTPSGVVSFFEGDKILATVRLGPEGTGAFTISTLSHGVHAIVASYKGDGKFDESISEQFNVMVGHR
ncbi:MAG TPA: Ig-like domain repeat protein [Blastocatellia bacterium]|nr:Ig-like domain repeat protein [Blastocatellia bacterium]